MATPSPSPEVPPGTADVSLPAPLSQLSPPDPDLLDTGPTPTA